MYLSKLEIHGFKSFAEPTVMRFDPGITAIVGPNGCGKSNVVDAIRWVIGEQRARVLRSGKMENIIFNGAATRRPLGLAEVQLTIENTRGVLPTEYAEVALGRRLYRSGESEYLLNGTPCRLRDIVGIFQDTGMGAGAYSVIELKMIEQILSENAEERRYLFEEAAGISKYKHRRLQAMRKLEGIQADLARLEDVRGEIEKRVRSLKRQAATATRHRDLEQRAALLRRGLARLEFEGLEQETACVRARLDQLRRELAGHTSRIGQAEATRESLRKTMVDREQALSRLQVQLTDHLSRVRDLESDLRLERQRFDVAERDRDRLGGELDDAAEEKEGLETALSRNLSALDEAKPRQREAENTLQQCELARDGARSDAEQRRIAARRLRVRESDLASDLSLSSRAQDRIANRMEFLGEEAARLDLEAAASEAAKSRLGSRLEAAAADVKLAEEQGEKVRASLLQVERQYDDANQELTGARQTLQELDRRYAARKAECLLLERLLASYDEFPEAIRFLASDPTWCQSEIQVLSDLFTCAPVYRAALDAALGEWGSCFVVDTERELSAAIGLLRAEEKGRAAFFVMERMDVDWAAALGEVEGTLLAHVQVKAAQYEPLARLLLYDTYLVEALATADCPGRFVTASGEWVDARGFVHAGGKAAGRSLARMERRDDLKAVREACAELGRKVERQTAKESMLTAALEEICVEEARAAVRAAEGMLEGARRQYLRLKDEHAALERQRRAIAERHAAVEKERKMVLGAADGAAVRELESRLESVRTNLKEADLALEAAERENHARQDQYAAAHVGALAEKSAREQIAWEIEGIRERLDAHQKHTTRLQERQIGLGQVRDSAGQSVVVLEEELGGVRRKRPALEEAAATAKADLLGTRVEIDQLETDLRGARRMREETLQQENALAVRLASLETQRAELFRRIPDIASANPAEVTNADEATAELTSLEDRLRAMGSVNALALEEYGAEQERLAFLTEQCEDLVDAGKTLSRTISEINVTAAARFLETYEAIEESFGELFRELFGGDASGHLALADPADPLETPINIAARPRGKRPIHISQLSSGEKTLTAIALLFAIYLVKPSPFCFLDEVDAPLDEANIERFMRLIRRFSLDTQFILVTHNKRTMEMADRLYGITMQEQGVSRLVGVQFEEAVELVG